MSSIFILTLTVTMGLFVCFVFFNQSLIFFQTSTGKRREELSGKKRLHTRGVEGESPVGVMVLNLLMVKLWYKQPRRLFALKGRSSEKLMFPFVM